MGESKIIFLLNIGNYAPQITTLTYPLIKFYAHKIGAEIDPITERKFPEWPVVYEKLQIYELSRRMKNAWSMYIDSDALVHPETIDFTHFLPRDTVAHFACDMAAVRWKYDQYFQRDGRNIGSCNWFTVASDWCLDLWKPLDDLTFEAAVENIKPTVMELNTIITRDHLIDDYVLSRNIAKYGLKFTTVRETLKRAGLPDANFFWHEYTISAEEKIRQINEVLKAWKLPGNVLNYGM